MLARDVMRLASTLLVLPALAAGCGSSTPDTADAAPTFATDGGRVTIDGCGYDLVTVVGAEAPQPSGTVIGGQDRRSIT